MGALLLAATVVSLACWGGLVAASLGIESPLRFLLAAYVLAWTGLVAATVALSLPHWLSREHLALSTAVLAVAALGLWLRRGRPRPPSPLPACRDVLGDPIVRVLAVAVAVGGVYLTALAFLTVPNDWDGLTYHETRALLWEQQGGMGYVPAGNDPRLNGNPPVSEIGVYTAMLLPRSERFAALPQFAGLWASVIAVMLLARGLGLPRAASVYGGLVFATLPVVLLHGAAILNDLVVASFLLAAVVFLLGRGPAELTLGSVSLGLALSTKFNAVLTLPLVLAVVLAGASTGRRRAAALACAGGIVLGSPWYLLNLVETGSPDGDLAEITNQAAERSLGAIVGSLRALSFDVVDTSGLWHKELVVAVVAGLLLAAVGLLGARGGLSGRTLVAAGLITAATPLLLRSLERPARYVWEHGWFRLGREDIALAHGDAWIVLGKPDTSLSWYGAAGTLVIVGGVVAAVVGARAGALPRVAILYALAPTALIVTFSLAIVYDQWRGRLLIAGVGLACAAWGWTLRVRWLALGTAALCCVTLSLSLVHSYTKPSGLGILEPPISRSVWGRDRIDTLTVIRNYDATPALLREIERTVPTTAELAVAMPLDSFLAPLAGPRLSRTLRLVAEGEHVPAGAAWLATRGDVTALGCKDAWQTVFSEDEYHSRLLRRIRPDACAAAVAPL